MNGQRAHPVKPRMPSAVGSKTVSLSHLAGNGLKPHRISSAHHGAAVRFGLHPMLLQAGSRYYKERRPRISVSGPQCRRTSGDYPTPRHVRLLLVWRRYADEKPTGRHVDITRMQIGDCSDQKSERSRREPCGGATGHRYKALHLIRTCTKGLPLQDGGKERGPAIV